MPALQMKRGSSTKCLRGHHQHSCHKSTKLSKDSSSQDKTSWQAVVPGNCNPSHDACSSIEVSGQNVEIKEGNDCPDEISGVSTKLRKLPSSLFPDHMPIERMGSLSVACPSDMETIFSPNFEHDNAEFKMTNQNVAAINEQNELPLLVSAESEDGSCRSSEFQSYNELDFYNFEDLATLKFDGDMGFIDVMDTTYPDFGCMSPDIMIDMMDRYMLLPFLEKTSETSIQNDDTVEETTMNTDDGCLYLAIHQMKSDHETDISYCQGYVDEMECIDQQLVFRNLPDLPEAVLSFPSNWIQNETQERKHITLVLDLDETLVHSNLEHSDDADFTFQVFFNMKQHTVYVRRRPYLQIFLERVAQMFKVVIFTASQSIYAEQLLDILDPERNLISQRIYRESCIFSDGSYTKDLTILGVDLAKVAIIDNSPQVFRLQVNNGIPIKSWFDDPSDSALISLLPFLETLVHADDVRLLIAKKFGSEE